MSVNKQLLTTLGLCTALIIPSAFASSDRDERGEYKRDYRELYRKRHQMNMDMMQMLSETMMILRDLNHKPSADEKARLSDMIKQLDTMVRDHKDMMRDYDKRHGGMMKNGDRMMDNRGGMMRDRDRMMDDR